MKKILNPHRCEFIRKSQVCFFNWCDSEQMRIVYDCVYPTGESVECIKFHNSWYECSSLDGAKIQGII